MAMSYCAHALRVVHHRHLDSRLAHRTRRSVRVPCGTSVACVRVRASRRLRYDMGRRSTAAQIRLAAAQPCLAWYVHVFTIAHGNGRILILSCLQILRDLRSARFLTVIDALRLCSPTPSDWRSDTFAADCRRCHGHDGICIATITTCYACVPVLLAAVSWSMR